MEDQDQDQKVRKPKPHYVVVQNVRKLAKEHDRTAPLSFLLELDRVVHHCVVSACKTYNGGRTRLHPSLIPKKNR
jgi:hypothetical protein